MQSWEDVHRISSNKLTPVNHLIVNKITRINKHVQWTPQENQIILVKDIKEAAKILSKKSHHEKRTGRFDNTFQPLEFLEIKYTVNETKEKKNSVDRVVGTILAPIISAFCVTPWSYYVLWQKDFYRCNQSY